MITNTERNSYFDVDTNPCGDVNQNISFNTKPNSVIKMSTKPCGCVNQTNITPNPVFNTQLSPFPQASLSSTIYCKLQAST